MSDVLLIAEATYPHSHGGVSVWCDQLIRGLGDVSFDVVAMIGSSTARAVWPLPENVHALVTVGLWDQTTVPAVRPSELDRYLPALELLLSGTLSRPSDETVTEALQGLREPARRGVLAALLLSPGAIDLVMAHLRPALSKTYGGIGPYPSTYDAVQILRFLEHLLRPLQIEPPRSEVTHSAANGLGVLVALAAKWEHGTPFLLTEHGLYLRERYLEYAPGRLGTVPRAFMPAFMARLVSIGYGVADHIAPGSEYNRTWEIASGADPLKIETIYNGIEPDDFPVPPPEPETPTLVWLGRIDPLKDVETLIASFSLVHLERPDVKFRLFGGVPSGNEGYAEACRALVGELGLDDCVSFEGRVDSVAEAYVAGHVVVTTSISEGFPYAVLEAMASGRCVVATEVGGVAEAIGDAGVLVPPRQPAAVAAACLALLADDDRRHSLADLGRERVRSLFTVEQCNSAYRIAYDDLLPNAPRVCQIGEPDEGFDDSLSALSGRAS